VKVYERPEDGNWKSYAQGCYHAAATVWRDVNFAESGSAQWPLFHGAVEVEILAVWPCPKSARKADRAIQRPRVGKPDADNLAKAVLDAGNGLLYLDDAQVAELHVRRIVGREGEAPRVEVTVREVATC
jgi:Holliday junction resolvase RusA-like endonuclease